VAAAAAAEVETAVAAVVVATLEVECGGNPLRGLLVKLNIPPGHHSDFVILRKGNCRAGRRRWMTLWGDCVVVDSSIVLAPENRSYVGGCVNDKVVVVGGV
jgi:hypothetical protein